jgi:outer membrane receptor for ferrienterochelin and colicins
VSQLQDQFKVGAGDTFRAALEYRHKDAVIDGNALVPQAPDLSENIYTTSGTWMHQINEKLSWTNAIRVDHLQMDQIGTLAEGLASTDADYGHAINTWSANSDIVYKVTDLDTFRMGYGRGVQLPSLLQSDFNMVYNFDGFPGDFEGNPKLSPTVVQDLSFDYSRKIPSLDSTLKLSPYYEFNQNITAPLQYIGTPQTVGGTVYPLLTSINVGDSHGWGGEIELKGNNQAGFRWDASYSYSRVVDDPQVLSAIDYQGSAPEHHFRFLLGYTTGPWEFDTDSQYMTSTDMLRSLNGGLSGALTPVYNYYSLSGRAGYKINDQLTLALSGTNLSQAATRENVYPDIQRQVFLSLAGKF